MSRSVAGSFGLIFRASRAATPQRWLWFTGAWVLWIAYAGLNVCLPNLMLKLSPERSNAPYIATFYAVTGLCYAASTVVGGLLVAPQDVDALVGAMITVLSDEDLRARLRQRGIARAERFSWEKTARETLAVYQEMAQR